MSEGGAHEKPFRVAFVVHVAVSGGLARFAKALLDGMLQADSTVEIGLFVDQEFVEKDRLVDYFRGRPVEIIPVKDPTISIGARVTDGSARELSEDEKSRLWKAGRYLLATYSPARRLAQDAIVRLRRVRRKEKPFYLFSMPSTAIARLRQYDVMYLALPLWLEPFDPGIPVVGTFHDLNYRHFPETFPAEYRRKWKRDFAGWLALASAAVVSTRFIESDLVDEFSEALGRTHVIYLAPYALRAVSTEDCDAALAKFGLDGTPYVIYPGNITPHKNILAFVQAAAALKKRMGSAAPRFVLTGIGTDQFFAERPPPYVASVLNYLATAGLTLGREVIATGYITDVEVDALTKSASLVVSTSLYEAGCGPAMDAWKGGVPVAFSDIPPFVEQLHALGVEALVFDPRDPESIADRIQEAIENPEGAKHMAERSQEHIARFTWADVGRQYLDVLRAAAGQGRRG